MKGAEIPELSGWQILVAALGLSLDFHEHSCHVVLLLEIICSPALCLAALCSFPGVGGVGTVTGAHDFPC